MKISNSELADIVELCFDLSMDLRLDPDERKEFLYLGKKLRGCLVNLISAQFEEDTQELLDANSQIKYLNNQLKENLKELEQIATLVTQIGQLAGILDGLLKIAVAFV